MGPATDDAPVLPYATPGDENFHPEAEALVHANAPPNAIGKFFKKKRGAAAGYYVRAKRRQFHPAAAGPACVACGSDAGGTFVGVRWLVRLRPPFVAGELRVSSADETATMTTWHPTCAACHGAWQSRLGWTAVARRAVRCVGVAVLAAWLACVVGAWVGAPEPLPWVVAAVALAVLLSAAVVEATIDWRVGRLTPPGVRRLMPTQVKCRGPVGLVPAAALANENVNDIVSGT